jgi:hypothetical protein
MCRIGDGMVNHAVFHVFDEVSQLREPREPMQQQGEFALRAAGNFSPLKLASTELHIQLQARVHTCIWKACLPRERSGPSEAKTRSNSSRAVVESDPLVKLETSRHYNIKDHLTLGRSDKGKLGKLACTIPFLYVFGSTFCPKCIPSAIRPACKRNMPARTAHESRSLLTMSLNVTDRRVFHVSMRARL